MKIARASKAHLARLYFLLVGILFVLSLATYGQSFDTAEVGIENFGKINDNYYRGSQPLADQFTQLKALGIKTVIDRKSTRLNSSHGYISYAVFCLKKKNVGYQLTVD